MLIQHSTVSLVIVMSLVCSIGYGKTAQKVDPFSKIIISSISAQCIKDHSKRGHFNLAYQNNVRVTFADNSTVTSDHLDIEIENTHSPTPQNASSKKSHQPTFKHVIFKDHVCIIHGQRKAQADTAHFDVSSKICILEGNVKMWQTKQMPNDIPLSICGNKATLCLLSGAFDIVGSITDPVCTTIELEDNTHLKKKMRIDRKQVKKKDASLAKG